MTALPPSTNAARKTAPVYLFFDGELEINAPLKEVWRHALNYPSWQNYSTVQTVSGKPGQEGEVVLLKKEELEFPPYYARTIRLEPQSRVAWKVYLEPATQPIDLFGIVAFRLHEARGRTRFCYELIYEFQVPYEHEIELETFRKAQHDSFAAALATMWPKLKKVTEHSG